MEVGDEGRWLDLEEIKPVFVPTRHDHMTCLHMTRLIRVVASPQLAAPSAGRIRYPSRIRPSPLQRDVGGS